MSRGEATPLPDAPRSGVLVVSGWTTGRLPLIRVTAWVDSAASPPRLLDTRSEAHAALDEWLDRLGVG